MKTKVDSQVEASTSGSAFPWKYDVFLSFRGEDTRKGFTDHLYDKLRWRGIRTFRDDPELERGTAISQELISAIEQSRFAIVVLSPNYASSTWCLLELCKIFECMEERGTILPIFYEVDPSHVRHQRGSFAEAFGEHEEKFGEDSKEVNAWRKALSKVANLAGWNSKDYRYETKLINEIIKELWTKVHPTFSVFYSSEELVGMENKLEDIDVLLDREANDVRFIGIWGMGGVGKTTLARMVYEKISHQFEVCIFLANVRAVSATATDGLVRLQKQLLSQIMKEKVQVWDVYYGMTRIKECVCNKAVLLVLDDVDQVEQLETLVREKDWFGLRSRIIITTRNRQILVTHGIEAPYELQGLYGDEALQLFSWKAFRKYEPEEDYAEYSKSFVMYAAGLPLSLKTLGSFLYKRSPLAWRSTLRKLEQLPNASVFEILKISYDGLDEMEKKVFLDIACFHRLYYDELMIEQVYSSDFCTRIVIDVLVEKCLLSIVLENKIEIHEMVEEMGREIVRRECCEEPGGRSRLWLRKDIFHVFKNNTGTKVIEGIFLQLDELEEADWNLEAFSIMCKLKLLYIDNLRLSLGPISLPNALRFLKWSWYPSKTLPPGFQPDELTELSLAHSNIDHLWDGVKHLGKLKSINLSYSIKLTRTPDFTGIQSIEKLVFEGCTNLVHIHPSIAFLNRLKILNFRNCKSIKSLPSKLEMESLETFDVFGCSSLKMIPEFGEKMNRLSKLYISGTAIEKLPSSIEHFSESLVELDLSGIVTRGLPYSLFSNRNLSLSFFGLFSRRNPLNSPLLPSLEHFSSLTTLDLNDCNLGQGDIPNSIGSLSSLTRLLLRGNNFVSLPAMQETPCSFYYFSFVIPGSEIFEWFSNQSLGDSVTAKLHSDPSNSSKFIGVAVCALLVPQDDPSAVPEDDELDPDTSEITCTWNGYSSGVSAVGFSIKQIVADHLYFVVLHKRFLKPKYCLEDMCNEVKFVFEVNRAEGNNRCLQVKKSGAYALYKHDMEEMISKVNQANSSISLYMEEPVDCDLDKSAYEQRSAIVKGIPEAAPSTSGGGEDEYYSAEE
uniref:TMV resistance protein N-like n=1 Tax=Fragaria vesca subsp. vesca TaxID=101020 RepID=UPI0005C9253F|nr:PREDICTED: TMV resistance protein N-like [Fragaria vesca subsp. vesca]